MATEIERKFLLKHFPALDVDQSSRVSIVQGYLNLDKERTVRVRITRDKAYLTVKGLSKGATRKEFEYEIPFGDATAMLDLCEGVVVKDRLICTHVNDKWEIDVFFGDNRGLIVAELEVPSEDYVINFPYWVGEEVTDDPRYFNSNLFKHPYKNWV